MNDAYSSHKDHPGNVQRRDFISTTLIAAGAALLPVTSSLYAAPQEAQRKKQFTVQEIINIILQEVPGAPFAETVDTIKSGNADTAVSGIVTTMFSTVKVINEAIRLKANFIIAHEPTFYNHRDEVNWTLPAETVKKKLDLLQRHNITVWRFHDYWHAVNPDGIYTGVLKMAGWEKYSAPGQPVLRIPQMSLKSIVSHLKSSLHIDHVKVIGHPEELCGKIAFLPGASGGQTQITLIEKENPDVLIAGEVHEWETAEYVRDSRLLGSKTSLIILGHSVSEEPGMQWLVEWLQPKIPGVSISHIASGEPFTWM